MKKTIIILFIGLVGITATAQDIKEISFKEDIEQRAIASPDTVYVINFWATWCAPCVKELPYFEQLTEKYKNEAVKVILVSLDFKSKLQKELIPFVKKHQLKSEVVISKNIDEEFINSVDKNWSGAIPATLVIHYQKGVRKFYEQEFTFQELENIYLKSK